MAQILVCSVPNPGHFGPMHAVGQRLAEAGHDILFYTAESFQQKVEASGFAFAPMHGRADYHSIIDEYFLNPPPPGPELLNLTVRALFCEPLVDQHHDLANILRHRSIDLMLIDTLFYGALPLLLGPRNERPPVICCGVNPMFLTGVDAGPTAPPAKTIAGQKSVEEANRAFLEMFEPSAACLREKLRSIAAPLPRTSFWDCFYTLPDRFLQFSVKEFEFAPSDRPSTVQFVGPILPTSETFDEPAWWADLDGARPVVLVTQGTVANKDLTELIEPTLNALASEDVLVVAATGSMEASVSNIPPNARVASFIPFDRILPKVSAFVTNGGYGAVNQSLAAGVPVITAGLTEDKSFVSLRVGASGAGINLETHRPGESQIRDAVQEVLTKPAYRQKASYLSRCIAEHNALDETAAAVDGLLVAMSARGGGDKQQGHQSLRSWL